MPDTIVEVEGVGRVSFPEGMTQEQMQSALMKLPSVQKIRGRANKASAGSGRGLLDTPGMEPTLGDSIRADLPTSNADLMPQNSGSAKALKRKVEKPFSDIAEQLPVLRRNPKALMEPGRVPAQNAARIASELGILPERARALGVGPAVSEARKAAGELGLKYERENYLPTAVRDTAQESGLYSTDGMPVGGIAEGIIPGVNQLAAETPGFPGAALGLGVGLVNSSPLLALAPALPASATLWGGTALGALGMWDTATNEELAASDPQKYYSSLLLNAGLTALPFLKRSPNTDLGAPNLPSPELMAIEAMRPGRSRLSVPANSAIEQFFNNAERVAQVGKSDLVAGLESLKTLSDDARPLPSQPPGGRGDVFQVAAEKYRTRKAQGGIDGITTGRGGRLGAASDFARVDPGTLTEPLSFAQEAVAPGGIKPQTFRQKTEAPQLPNIAPAGEFVRAEDAYAAARKSEPGLTRQQFARRIYEAHRADQEGARRYEFEHPTGNAKERDVFKATAEDGASLRYYGWVDKGESPLLRTPKPTAKTTELQSAAIPYLKEFVEQDVAPKAKEGVAALRDSLRRLNDQIAPVYRAERSEFTYTPEKGAAQAVKGREFVDASFQMKGARDRAQFEVEAAGRLAKRAFDKMPDTDKVAFVDRYKRGEAQPDASLQAIDEFYRKADKDLYDELQKYSPSLPFLENHFRVVWKTVPSTQEAGGVSAGKRPLQGSKGMLKKSTLPDMSAGVARGGVPVSYNPQVLFEHSYADAMKYITAQKMWAFMKQRKFAQFVKEGKSVPAGFTRLDDRLANVYIHSDKGAVKTGEWYVEENAARMLNNFLSRDFIRENPAGAGLVGLKNAYTAAELGLSPFHALFETAEAVGSVNALGIRKMWNLRDFKGGLKDIATAQKAFVDVAVEGGKAIKYLENAKQLKKEAGWNDIEKLYPEADRLLNDLFEGGGQLTMHQDYKLSAVRGLQEAAANNNYIGATLRALPALNEALMKPLFENYIPRLKVGMFLREYSVALRENARDLSSGKITRAQLARKTWAFVEDRFGEMNFDNLFWDRTFKTAMQLMFRSVTWKLGSLRAALGAAPEQGAEFLAALKGRRNPRLMPKTAWLLGMSWQTVLMGAVVTYAFTGEKPKRLLDYVFPRTDPKDPKMRLSTPTYWKDIIHLSHSPSSYITSSMSGPVGRIADIWNNKDFFGNQIHDAEPKGVGDWANARWDDLKHMLPVPFSISGYLDAERKGATGAQKYMPLMGLQKAPSYITQSPAEQKMLDYYARKQPVGGRTKEEAAKREAASALARTKAEKGDIDTARVKAKEAGLNNLQIRRALQRKGMPIDGILKALTIEEALEVYEVATDEEKARWKTLVRRKLINHMKRSGRRTPAAEKARALGLIKRVTQP